MATVYRGVQPSLNRSVAIKVLFKKLSVDNEIVARFNRESLIIAKLTHPNIIHVIDRGITQEGMPYFVMDFVEGSDLTKLIQQPNGVSLFQKLDMIIQVTKALSYAHKNGVIHRDIKPANILIDKDNNIMVTDFGIAQFFDKNTNENQLTKAGITLGTPSYMSPEQKMFSKDVTASSDIYSLGVVMYELFTGVKPLGRFKMPSELNQNLPQHLDAVILKCLETNPADRYTSADEVRVALLELLQGSHLKDNQKQKAIVGMAKMDNFFELLDVIKEHQYGAVYLFRHKVNKTLMIVKKYSSPLGGYREAKLFQTLKHNNIVNIYGVSGSEDLYIIVMEYIDGGSLKDRMVRPHPWQEVLKIGKEICNALAFAHNNRIIHGNLRPSNILITSKGDIKLSDFGLKEHYTQGNQEDNWYNTFGKPKSKQTDIFSAGVILYELATGILPVWIKGQFAPHQAFFKLPDSIQEMISTMLSPDPHQRYPSFDEAITIIEDTLTSRPQKQDEPSIDDLHTSLKTEKAKPSHKIDPMLRTRLLFILFISVVIAYIFFTGKTEYYIALVDHMISFFQNLIANK